MRPEGVRLRSPNILLRLLLALARHIPAANSSIKAGRWDKSRLLGVELHGKVLGIIGLGKIGKEVAQRAQAFGMRVIASDPFVSCQTGAAGRGDAAQQGRGAATGRFRDAACQRSPMTRAARAGCLAPVNCTLLKPGAYLVNCARGSLIDEQALLAALNEGRLAGVALDVFSQEPIGDDTVLRQLLSHERVIATPHLGASTVEAQVRVATEVARNIIAALRGDTLYGVRRSPSHRQSLPNREQKETIVYTL